MTVKKITYLLAGAILALGTLAQARAEDQKSDPSGTYVWTTPGRNGGADRTNTLVLKLSGDKLNGTITAPGRGGQNMETQITDGKLAGSDVSFAVVRQFNGNSMTNKYSGKFADGAIKGKMEFTTRNGDAQTRDWEAKQQK